VLLKWLKWLKWVVAGRRVKGEAVL